jgi:hypothetical protein
VKIEQIAHLAMIFIDSGSRGQMLGRLPKLEEPAVLDRRANE